jgi:origin recognition complex subunit 5
VTSPAASLLRTAAVATLQFPPYTKTEYVAILSQRPPAALPNTTAQETRDLWTRFTAAVHDSHTRPAVRTLPALEQACDALWPRFTAPVAAGTHKAREFSKLLVAARGWFGSEAVLEPGMLSAKSQQQLQGSQDGSKRTISGPPLPKTDLAVLLPPAARLLLVAAYLASHNAPRHDQTLFSTWHSGKRRRGGGATIGRPPQQQRGARAGRQHRRIARKLLGPGVFVLERMVAIHAATCREWTGGAESPGVDGDVGMALATLASLRLLVRVGSSSTTSGGNDMDRGGRWRVNVGWEAVRGVGRSMGIEVEDWLVE